MDGRGLGHPLDGGGEVGVYGVIAIMESLFSSGREKSRGKKEIFANNHYYLRKEAIL